MRRSAVVALVVVAACNGGEPSNTTGDGASQAPPPDAGSVDITAVELVTASDGAVARVDGSQPTPCHQVGWVATPQDGRVEVAIWSEPPSLDTACAQVIEPFSIEIDLGPVETETEVVINDEVVGTVG